MHLSNSELSRITCAGGVNFDPKLGGTIIISGVNAGGAFSSFLSVLLCLALTLTFNLPLTVTVTVTVTLTMTHVVGASLGPIVSLVAANNAAEINFHGNPSTFNAVACQADAGLSVEVSVFTTGG